MHEVISEEIKKFLTKTDCPYCHEFSFTRIIADNPKIVECNTCGLWRMLPRINRDGQIFFLKNFNDSVDLGKYHPVNNFLSKERREKKVRKWGQNLFPAIFPFDEVRAVKFFFPDILKDSGILDVGSSSGEFIYSLSQKCGINAEGLEPIHKVAEYGKSLGLNIHVGRFEREGIPPALVTKKFSIVCFRECFYYMQDLRETFDLLDELLIDGGGVYLKCHVPTSIYYRKNNYLSRYSPYASVMPTLKSLKSVFIREGYKIIGSGYLPFNPVSLMFRSLSKSFLGKQIERAGNILSPLFCGIGKADIIYIFTRKQKEN